MTVADPPRSALSWALRLTVAGYQVFPCGADKRPLTTGGFHDATDDPDAIRRWWKQHPDALIGLALPDGTMVVDFDSAKPGFDPAKADALDLPDTLIQQTRSGGYHAFLRIPDGMTIKQGSNVYGPGIDTRVAGKGYVIAYDPEGLCDNTPETWALAPERLAHQEPEPVAPSASASASALGTRDAILSFLGPFAARGLRLSANDYEAILKAKRDAGEIIALDERRPWTDQDLRKLAQEAAKWPIETPGEVVLALSEATASLNDPEEPTDTGTKTLWDMPFGPPAPQLAPPFLAAEGVTVLYGTGGVGKGYIALHLIHRLVSSGLTVMVVDYETHPGEWGRRARALGFSEEEMRMVHYLAPFGPDWHGKMGPLNAIAPLLREQIDQLGVQYVVIDSYVPAAEPGEAMGGSAAAQEFFAGCSILGNHVLVLAHVAGGQNRFPDKPFGSTFVHNLARETWAVERVGDDGDDIPFDQDTIALQPQVMSLELRNKKRSEGQRSRPQFLDFSFNPDGTVDVTVPTTVRQSVPDLITDVLARAKDGMTVSAILRAIREESGVDVDPRVARTAISRHSNRFVGTADVPKRWKVLRGGRLEDGETGEE